MCSSSSLWYGSIVAALCSVVFWLIPSPIDPPVNAKLSDKRPSFTGPLEPNYILSGGQHIFVGEVFGPESFAVNNENVIYTGLGDGRVVRLVNGVVQNVTSLGKGNYEAKCADPSTREGCGRPLGMEFQPDGKLYVVDSFRGLYSIDVSSGKTELIWDISHDVIGASKVGFPNYFAVLDNGSIIVTDTSERCSQMSIALSFVEFRAEGKVVLYNPSSKETHVILRNLSFPNGLLLSKDGSFVYIAETGRARILRYYLKGPKSGTYDVFMSNLPGLPDNLSYSKRGTIWVPFGAVRHDDVLDFMVENAWLRSLLCKLRIDIETLISWGPGYGLVLEVNEDGDILRSYHDPTGTVINEATEIADLGERILVGSYKAHYLVLVDLPELV